MTRPLRQRHRKVVLTLSVFLPAAFVLGIASRRVAPLISIAPTDALYQKADSYKSVWVRDDLWEKSPLRTRLLSDSTTSNLALEVTAKDPIIRPDVLMYWVQGTPKINDSLPSEAILLGSWTQDSANALAVPRAAKIAEGKLLLYSLADHEIVNVTTLLFLK